MSVAALTWALDFHVRGGTEKLILLVLANYANEHGISWPSQRTLADQTALGERTVRRVLGALETDGVIRRVRRRRGNGSRRSDMIVLSAFEGRTQAPPGLLEDAVPSEAERPGMPPDNRPERHHLPAPVAPLEPSLILKTAAISALPKSHLACLSVTGPGFDQGERGHPSTLEIDRWLCAGCDLITDILPVIAAKTAEPRDQPIRSWGYFTAAILAAKARRKAPLPQREENRNEHDRRVPRVAQRGRAAARGLGDAWDAAIAELDQEGPAAAKAIAGGSRADCDHGGGPERSADTSDAREDRGDD